METERTDNCAEKRSEEDEMEGSMVGQTVSGHQWRDLQNELMGECNVVPGLKLIIFIFLQCVCSMGYDAFTDNVAETGL